MTFYILIATVNGLVLIGWAKYNQFRFRVERRSRRPGLEDHELAESLRITRELVTELNKARVLTVHHHESGEISHIDVDRDIADNRLPPPTPAMLEYLPPEQQPSWQRRSE